MHIYKAQESCLFVNNLQYTVLADYFIACQNWIEFNTFFDFQVAVVHEKFLEALEALFEKYKRELGFEDTILEIY
jgi:hypothetical protein